MARPARFLLFLMVLLGCKAQISRPTLTPARTLNKVERCKGIRQATDQEKEAFVRYYIGSTSLVWPESIQSQYANDTEGGASAAKATGKLTILKQEMTGEDWGDSVGIILAKIAYPDRKIYVKVPYREMSCSSIFFSRYSGYKLKSLELISESEAQDG